MDGTRQLQMPPKTSIPRDQIAVLARWIDQGAKVDAEAVDARRLERQESEAEEAATFASDSPGLSPAWPTPPAESPGHRPC